MTAFTEIIPEVQKMRSEIDELSKRQGSTGGSSTDITLPHIATPAAPASGNIKVYAKSDDKLYKQTSGGVETEIGAGGSLVAAPASDHMASGTLIALTAGVTMNFGDVGYIKSDGKVGLIDADAIATMSGVVMCADASITANASGNFLLFGIARDDTWAWTVGGLIYGTVTGTTGNTLSQTAPTGTDDVVQIMGVATHADRMLFKPSLAQVELT